MSPVVCNDPVGCSKPVVRRQCVKMIGGMGSLAVCQESGRSTTASQMTALLDDDSSDGWSVGCNGSDSEDSDDDLELEACAATRSKDVLEDCSSGDGDDDCRSAASHSTDDEEFCIACYRGVGVEDVHESEQHCCLEG